MKFASKYFSTLGAVIALAFMMAQPAGASDQEDDFDRLDGVGPSGIKAQFIEWEGNAEIHVYPKGGLAGLGLKLLKNEKGAYVFVIAYRFSHAPKEVLIRRNVLSDKWVEGYKVYRAPSDADYDKIVISPNTLSDMRPFKLDAAPTQLYPDGHPSLKGSASPTPAPQAAPPAVRPSKVRSSKVKPASASARNPSVARDPIVEEDEGHVSADDEGVDEAGTVRPFFMEPRGKGRR